MKLFCIHKEFKCYHTFVGKIYVCQKCSKEFLSKDYALFLNKVNKNYRNNTLTIIDKIKRGKIKKWLKNKT